MKCLGIAAVMIHVPDLEQGLEWYRKAFPDAVDVSFPEFNFKCLRIGDVSLELVKADEKVGVGTYGIAVDWKVENFDAALKSLQELGATLYRGPMKIENGWRMCKLKDPFGNLLGLRGP